MIKAILGQTLKASPGGPRESRSVFSRWIGRTVSRHIFTFLMAGLLVYMFAVAHAQWSDMHRWNKAAADASLLLLTITMAVGPAARLWPTFRRFLPWRREFGVYAVLLAVVHTIIILGGWVEWSLARLAGLAFHPDLGRYVMVEHGFGLANLIGVAALGYGFVLMFTSNDRAVRLLSGSAWKFVQTGAYVLWALVILHTAYFLFMHFLDFHRPLPAPNPLRWPFVGLILLVLLLRCSAFVQTWRHRQKATERQRGPARRSMQT